MRINLTILLSLLISIGLYAQETGKISGYIFNNDQKKLSYSSITVFDVETKKSFTIYSNENGYFLIYLSDRYGFNNPDKEWDSDEIEYLLIGKIQIVYNNLNLKDFFTFWSL